MWGSYCRMNNHDTKYCCKNGGLVFHTANTTTESTANRHSYVMETFLKTNEVTANIEQITNDAVSLLQGKLCSH